jgi:Uri superfamily endonuclease
MAHTAEAEGETMGKGSYILVLQLEQAIDDLQVGKLGRFRLPAGYYVYIGSAFGSGGLPARIRYHQRREKMRPHWHIDYLRARSRLCEAWTVTSTSRLECRWCNALAHEDGVGLPIAGFGSSDTNCRSHLFYLPCPPRSSLLSRVILTDLVADGPAEIQIEVLTFDPPA